MNYTLRTTLLDRIECLERSGRQDIPWNEVATNDEAVALNLTVGLWCPLLLSLFSPLILNDGIFFLSDIEEEKSGYFNHWY